MPKNLPTSWKKKKIIHHCGRATLPTSISDWVYMTGLVSCSLASCSVWLRSCNIPFSPFPQCKRRNFSTQPQKLSLFPLFLSLPVCKTGIAVKRKLSLTCVHINNLNLRHSWFYRRGTVSAWLCVKQRVENSMFLIWGRKRIVFTRNTQIITAVLMLKMWTQKTYFTDQPRLK